MPRKRQTHTAALKAQVALAAVKNDRTVNELASHFGVHPTLVHGWKKQLVRGRCGRSGPCLREMGSEDQSLRCHSQPTDGIDAEESKVLLKILAEADWKDVNEAITSTFTLPILIASSSS